MNTKPPVPVIVVALLFILSGVFGLIYHATDYIKQANLNYEEFFILVLRVLAMVAGVFLLRGARWARWLALAWMAYHAVLGAFHSATDALTHVAILIVITILLFLPKSSLFFKNRS